MIYSLAGLVGVFFGTVLGVIVYMVIVSIVARRMTALDASRSNAERAIDADKLSWLRQPLLALHIVVFGTIGYWFGKTVAG